MPTAVRTYEYRAHRIEISAFLTGGRWNAEVCVRGPLTDEKPQFEVIRSYVSAELAERAARELARRWIDVASAFAERLAVTEA